MQQFHTKEITCPFCGQEESDSWEASDCDDRICDECGKEFTFTREVEVSYNSYCKIHQWIKHKYDGKEHWNDFDTGRYIYAICEICEETRYIKEEELNNENKEHIGRPEPDPNSFDSLNPDDYDDGTNPRG